MGELPQFEHVGNIVGGRYELRGGLGRGGFAEVYRAWDRLDDREVALKVLQVPGHLSAPAQKEFIEKFQEEAKLTRKVFQGQPHVRQVLDMGVWGFRSSTSPWMAMELLEGETLGEALRARRRGSPRRSEVEVMSFFVPVLAVIAFAHSKGIAHRDLKPANIFLAREGSQNTLKVLDFGIAKVLQGDEVASGNTMTSSTMQMFSPQYGAPEQFAAKKTGKYTDVFALGLILTELLTDVAPLSENGDRTECMMAALDKRERPTPRQRGALEVSDAVEAVIGKALSIAEHDRYPDAGALLSALQAAVPQSGVSPAPSQPESAPSQPQVIPSASTHFAERIPSFRAEPTAEAVAVAARTQPTAAAAAKAQQAGTTPRTRSVVSAAGVGLALILIAAAGLVYARRSPGKTEIAGVDASSAPPAVAAPATPSTPSAAEASAKVAAAPATVAAVPTSATVNPVAPAVPAAGSPPGTQSQGNGAAAIERLVAAHSAAIKRACWNPYAADKESASVTVTAVVASDGTVTSTSSTGDDPAVAKCAENQVRTWSFPPQATTVNIPYKFVRQDTVAKKEASPDPAPVPTTAAESTAPFDRGAAAHALVAVNVQKCKKPDGPTGSGHVSVTFSPSGNAEAVSVDEPFAGTPVGTCIAVEFRKAHVPAFGGGTVKVGKSFTIN
jgi:serine/threonine protein kinase